MVSVSISEDVPGEVIFKLGADAVTKSCDWVQFGINAYIPLCKYQVKPHSFPWFSAVSAATIAHRKSLLVISKLSNFLVPIKQKNLFPQKNVAK